MEVIQWSIIQERVKAPTFNTETKDSDTLNKEEVEGSKEKDEGKKIQIITLIARVSDTTVIEIRDIMKMVKLWDLTIETLDVVTTKTDSLRGKGIFSMLEKSIVQMTSKKTQIIVNTTVMTRTFSWKS